MSSYFSLALALALFVGSHSLLSHPLRAATIRNMGKNGFLTLYSLIAMASLMLVAIAYDRASEGPMLWNGTAALPWGLSMVLTFIATGLFMASFAGNPALTPRNMNGLSTILPHGVFLVTRHPMLFAVAIWALSHLIVTASPRAVMLYGALALMAVGGARAQDAKFARLYGREWQIWSHRTPFWPDLRALPKLGGIWAGAAVVWLVVTTTHWLAADIPAGLFHFFDPRYRG